VKRTTTLTEIIANALREALSKKGGKKPRRDFKVIPSGRGGVFPGVDFERHIRIALI